MLKTLLATASIAISMSVLSAVPARADHIFDRFAPFFLDLGDSYAGDDYFDDREDIVIPRRDRGDYVYDEDADEFVLKPRFKKKPRAKTKAARLSPAEKRRIAAITGKPQPQVRKVAAKPMAKPVVKVAAIEKPKMIVEPVTTATIDKPVRKTPRLVLDEPKVAPKVIAPKVASVPPAVTPKSSISRPLTDDANVMSCEKAQSIVSGYGFQSVSPQMCVGKTYSFRATRDGKLFEIRMSSASGELTEVRKL